MRTGRGASGKHDLGINEHNRRCFDLAVGDGVREAEREAAFMVAMMARAIERIGDNAVDIGRQVGFVVTGLCCGFVICPCVHAPTTMADEHAAAAG